MTFIWLSAYSWLSAVLIAPHKIILLKSYTHMIIYSLLEFLSLIYFFFQRLPQSVSLQRTVTFICNVDFSYKTLWESSEIIMQA